MTNMNEQKITISLPECDSLKTLFTIGSYNFLPKNVCNPQSGNAEDGNETIIRQFSVWLLRIEWPI